MVGAFRGVVGGGHVVGRYRDLALEPVVGEGGVGAAVRVLRPDAGLRQSLDRGVRVVAAGDVLPRLLRRRGAQVGVAERVVADLESEVAVEGCSRSTSLISLISQGRYKPDNGFRWRYFSAPHRCRSSIYHLRA